MAERPMALLVTSDHQHAAILRRILESLGIEVLIVENCLAARRLLGTQPNLDVVITAVTLSDGNWCDLLECAVDRGMQASFLVSAGTADERLWSEVIWRGGHDLLVEPFKTEEVRRIVDGALRAAHAPISWKARGQA